MPATRTTLNLKHTSIHDHLLDNKHDTQSTVKCIEKTSMADIKQSTFANASDDAPDNLIDNEVHHLVNENSNEYLNSLLSNTNGGQEVTPAQLLNGQHSMTARTCYAGHQIAESLVKSSKIHHQQMNAKIWIFSGTKNENSEQWLHHVLTIIEQQELTPSEQRDVAAGRLDDHRTRTTKLGDH